MNIIIAIFIGLIIFISGILMGVAICTKDTKKTVEKEMWRLCEICKYKHLKGTLPKGKWLKSQADGDTYITCSCCKSRWSDDDLDIFISHYCPNCGAEMEE